MPKEKQQKDGASAHKPVDAMKILSSVRRRLRAGRDPDLMLGEDPVGSTQVQTKRHFTKHFVIGKGAEQLQIEIPEAIGESYGTYVWPCAIVLAQYVWNQRKFVMGKRVLEIGCGTALPGVTAGMLGAQVTLSDTGCFPDALRHAKKSCVANKVNLPVKSITWGQFDPDIFDLHPVDIILGSDCFFDPKEFEDILMTVSYLISRKPTCQFWCSYQERSSNWNIEWFLHKWSLVCHEVALPDLPNFEAETLVATNSIHLFIISQSVKESDR